MKDRPKEYFSHDYNAEDDPKLQRVLMQHGSTGYGIYWRIVERLYRNEGRLDADYAVLAHALRDDAAVVSAIVTKFDLFYSADGGARFGSKSVDRRLAERREKSSKAREAAFARHRPAPAAQSPASCERSADAVRTHSERIAGAVQGKERKEKEIERPLTAVSSRDGKGTTVNIQQRAPSAAVVAQDARAERLLDMPYPVHCGYHQWKIRDLPADYCADTLARIEAGTLTKIGPELRRALQLRVEHHLEAVRR